jgi:hypothetical protein
LHAVFLRSEADSAAKFNWCIHHSATIGETPGKCKEKIQCICGSPYMRFRVSLRS